MAEVQAEKPKRGFKLLLTGVAVVGLAAVLYVIVAAVSKPSGPTDLKKYATGGLSKLVVAENPVAPPPLSFTGPDGKPMTFADFKGQVLVLNLWASWCGPCKTEMPTLAKLQAVYAAQPVSVVPVTVDKDSDINVAKADLAKNAPLKLYRDPVYALPFGLVPRVEGFPTTLVIDKQGRERARLSGDADWASPEARALVEQLLRES
jgi:thiol-disulfide isomerase/thioredoxin